MSEQMTQGSLVPDAQRAFAEGNLARAEKYCNLQLKYQPGDRDARVVLGMVLGKAARVDEAIEILNEVNREEPSYEAHLVLSTLFFARRDIEHALIEAEAAIAIAPEELATYEKVGHELVRLGRPDIAVDFFGRAVDMNPDNVDQNQNLAAALKDADRGEEALNVWRHVTELAPRHTVAWLNYGLLALARQDPRTAFDAGMKAVYLAPANVEAHLLVGLAASDLGRGQEAERHFKRVLELEPGHTIAQASLGVVLYEQGRFETGLQRLRESLTKWDTNGLAYYMQARSKRVGPEDSEMVSVIETLLERPNLRLQDRSYMEYALGKSYEDLKDYARSMAHFDRANEAAYQFWLADKPWDRDRYVDTIDRTIETFTSDRMQDLSSHGLASEVPVFIVGMIRSGTSLVEQILTSHPDVAGGGELTYWHDQAAKAFDIRDNSVDVGNLIDAANGYLELLKTFGSTARRVTDKLPHNFALLGLTQPALPNGRIIHIRRNPVDNCLSVYTTAYNRPPGFTLKRENILLAYRQYLRMVAHWRQVLPADRFLEIDYEDLIANREMVTRRMISFLGLEWSDQCLRHEDNKRVVHTPSTWQVRQPLYTSSIERWRNFEPWIAPFDELLSA